MKVLLALLASCAWSWKLDLRHASTDPLDLYLSPGDNVDIVLNGQTNYGVQWFYHLTNKFIVHFTNTDY